MARTQQADANKTKPASKTRRNDASRSAIKYSFLKILTGSDLSRRRLAKMQASSDRPGPVVWLTACSHGDEVGGAVVIQEIFKRIRKLPLLCGQLHAFPLMNPLGFEISSRHVAFSGEDLNRCFPGNPNGSLAQRIAHVIFTRIEETNPTLVLDLHNDWRNSIPYTVLDPPPGHRHRETHTKARKMAKNTGLLLVSESDTHSEAKLSPTTLTGSLLRRSIPALTLELGESDVVNERNVEFGVGAIWNCLESLAMVGPQRERFQYPAPDPCRGQFLPYTGEMVSSTSGILRFLVKPGQVVCAKQPLARTYNAFGKLLETVCSPCDAIVLGHSDSSVAYPGGAVAALAATPEIRPPRLRKITPK